MSSDVDVVAGVDLTGDDYVIRQSLIRNKYAVYDADGELLLRTKQKLFKVKEQFPFQNADGDEVFRVTAQNIFDIAGDYAITTAGTDEPIAVLQKNFTFFKHVWKIRDPETESLLATVESRSTFVEVLRNLSGIFGLIPHKYSITDPDGRELGTLEGRFSLRDTYDLRVEDTGDAPKEAIVAAAVAIDALEGN